MTIQRIGSTEGLKDVFGVKVVPVISLAVVHNGIVSIYVITAEPRVFGKVTIFTNQSRFASASVIYLPHMLTS
jgi:hypothetical protein